MLELISQESMEKILKEGSLQKLLSAYVGLAEDLVSSGEMVEEEPPSYPKRSRRAVSQNNLKSVFQPVFQKNTSK